MPKTSHSSPPATATAAMPAAPSARGSHNAGLNASDEVSQHSQQQAADDSVAQEDSRETRIRRAAYDAYLRRGGESGDEIQDWLDAEAQVDGRTA